MNPDFSRPNAATRRRSRALVPMLFAIPVVALLLLASGTLAPSVFAHEDDPKLLYRARPIAAPIYHAPPSGSEPLASTTFESSGGVRLMTWIPLNNFAGSPVSGNDCWGYTSPSGREYALIGLSNGTGIVEVTEPNAATIVTSIPGPESFLRDVKTHGSYAYVVSEGGGGIQVLDLSQIDAGTVTLAGVVDDTNPPETHNVAIDTDRGFLYRCGGANRGIRIYSLANPIVPTLVGAWDDRYVHDAQVVLYTEGPYAGRELAYCCTGFNAGFTETGLTVLDVTDKGNITVESQVDYPDARYSHQSWLSEDRQYLFHGDELDETELGKTTTTRVFDVSDPSNTTLAATIALPNTASGHNMYVHGTRLYQANFRSGLRILDVADPLAPEEIAWFDTFPDDDAAPLNGLWSCYPYFESGTIIGSDIERGLFVWRFGPPIEITLRGQLPDSIHPDGDALRMEVHSTEGANVVPGEERVHYDIGGGFVTDNLVKVGPEIYDAIFPASTCGDEIRYYFSALGDDGVEVLNPPGAPDQTFRAVSAAFLSPAFADNMEADTGWTVGDPGDDATGGVWTRVDPQLSLAQPGDDHTPEPGRLCWVTGQGDVGGPPEQADVDGGTTTLTTPTFSLTDAAEPRVSYYRWFSNDKGAAPAEDTLVVEISNDEGATWLPVETVGPTGTESEGGWFLHQFDPRDILTPNDQMRLRFVVSDLGDDSVVEAAIDDFSAVDVRCELDEPIALCAAGAVNIDCGPVTELLTINGSTGGSGRMVIATQTTPLTFSLSEAPSTSGDGRDGRAVIYAWSKIPESSDVVPVPGNLGLMCFGPQIITTLNPLFTWNSVGAENKLGDHDAPGAPPMIPDASTLEFLNVGQGAGRRLRLTVQAIVPDTCSQSNKPFSVTNGVGLEID